MNITGSTIPSEPMYLIINTAVSSTWGFPAPMPAGCKCKSFECGDPDCECAFPPGFCANFPATFEIDHVRVYQAEGHTLACSTKERPTHQFIEGHKERYTNPDFPEEPPLYPQVVGGAACGSDSDCGHGICSTSSSTCDCTEGGGTGPSCRAWAMGYDASVYQELGKEEALTVQGVYVSGGLAAGLLVGLGIFLWQFLKRVQERRERMRGYSYVNNFGGAVGGGGAYGAGAPTPQKAEARPGSESGSYYQRGVGNTV
ncbi:hypothetical protein TeGR_g3736 [Tetraparma gracilis]|uniref:EGF-like domain-containing protein n=1 Tax=Tetraparma gracilis TaxID=2962635 RepID=A0ABQ6MB97_9STRA|nr:hypothetical protein TeGR_g3736 [Tetraparma gracilis]